MLAHPMAAYASWTKTRPRSREAGPSTPDSAGGYTGGLRMKARSDPHVFLTAVWHSE
jgi:hypothetical protein